MADRLALFVTEVYRADLGEEPGFVGLLEDLRAACRMVAEEDRAGRAWCRRHHYPGYTSYASLDDLPLRASAFGELKRRLDRHAAGYAAGLNIDLKGRRLKLDSLWINVLRSGGFHSGHIHPGSVVSGTLYLDAPPGSGALRLEDPRLAMMMGAPPERREAPLSQRRFVELVPAPGVVFLWESWLRHEVMSHHGKSRRVSVSFNYA